MTTKESDIIPLGSQVRSLDQVGKGAKRRRYRTPSLRVLEKGLILQLGKGHDSYVRKIYEKKNNNNKTTNDSFGTSILYNISLARWKIQRKKNLWSKEGK